jgi:hypothetical protein
MANKISYVKDLRNGNQLVLIIGYVGQGMAHLFERNKETNETVTGSEYTMPTSKAVELYLLKD